MLFCNCEILSKKKNNKKFKTGLITSFILLLLLHLHVVPIKLVFDLPCSVTRLNLFVGCFLDDSCFFKEPAGIVCHAFEAFSY